jgi:16S rRNA (guanine1207-N2)-methyltransferase
LLRAIDREAAGERWLVIGGEALLVSALAGDHPAIDIQWIATDVREARDLPRDHPGRLRVDLDAAHPDIGRGSHDLAVLAAPPDRALRRRWLVLAATALRHGGALLIAGANAEGIRSAIGDARKLFGAPVFEDYGGRQRIARFVKPPTVPEPPPWASDPGIAPGTWRELPVAVHGEEVPLVTLPGVFAADRLDPGTQMLLDALPGALPDQFPDRLTGSVLDVGCGMGVIGITASRLGAERVDMVDASLLAVAAARKNVARLGVAGACVLASDVYDAVPGERYDLIVSNPPFHRGKAIDLAVADRLIREAPAHLHPGGSLLIVANAFLAYGKRMDRVFRQVETVAASRQYHVISARDPR